MKDVMKNDCAAQAKTHAQMQTHIHSPERVVSIHFSIPIELLSLQ